MLFQNSKLRKIRNSLNGRSVVLRSCLIVFLVLFASTVKADVTVALKPYLNGSPGYWFDYSINDGGDIYSSNGGGLASAAGVVFNIYIGENGIFTDGTKISHEDTNSFLAFYDNGVDIHHDWLNVPAFTSELS
ncbi:MAG: hypothetical protein LBU65_07765, partial [Planctomycetaceae bacterium]|nr:hypothetical protein [Planctomycetaceae bacterium]